MQGSLFSADVVDPGGAAALLPIDRKQASCMKCPLAAGRKLIVPGEGNPDADIMFIGEGPGAQEDATGHPFVGRAGKLLDKMIVAMGTEREACYITNVVCCRPPQNRKPEPEEIQACSEYLFGRIRAVRPKVIVALGATAGQALIKTKRGVAELRGKWHTVGQLEDGIPVRVTYHPAFLLRPQGARCKRLAWDDLKAVLALLGKETQEKS